MRATFSVLFLVLCLVVNAQRFKADSTHVSFYSKAPLEDIKAKNIASSSLIDQSNGAIVIVVPVESFDFKKRLMQEHFNENYLESEKYPNAVFKGKIKDWRGETGSREAVANGTLELHGVTKEIEIQGQLEFDGTELVLTTVFPIKLKDYKIKIPKAVFYNIAEEVEVTAYLEYKPYEKD